MASERCLGQIRAFAAMTGGSYLAPCAKRRRLSSKSSPEEAESSDSCSSGAGSEKHQQAHQSQQQQRRIAGAATPCRRAAASLEKGSTASRLGASPLRTSPPAIVALAGAPGGPYSLIASCLGDLDLCRLDRTCRPLREVNGSSSGSWRCHGEREFLGMELDAGSGFLPAEEASGAVGGVSWKRRCELFRQEAPTFSQPFNRAEIANVENPDEVAYCRCRIRTDHLLRCPGAGVYVEVDVLRNADNLSLAIVDFEGGGRSSVTFSPETGAVLRERKVREAPRAIEGTYLHLLPAAPAGRRFEGTMGLYLQDGHLCFFRRWSRSGWRAEVDSDVEMGETTGIAPTVPEQRPAWETTGFCTDLTWAQGSRLSVCLAFRDEGAYRVRMSNVGNRPPLPPKRSVVAYQQERWSLLYGDDDHPLAI